MQLPHYLQQEVLRRLSPERGRILAKGLGLDPDKPLPIVDPNFLDRGEFSGNLEFDLTIGALGQCISLPCRLSFTTDLGDGVDLEIGKSIRVLGRGDRALHAFVSTGKDHPAFEWAAIPYRLIPAAAIAKLEEQVNQLAIILEDGRPRR